MPLRYKNPGCGTVMGRLMFRFGLFFVLAVVFQVLVVFVSSYERGVFAGTPLYRVAEGKWAMATFVSRRRTTMAYFPIESLGEITQDGIADRVMRVPPWCLGPEVISNEIGLPIGEDDHLVEQSAGWPWRSLAWRGWATGAVCKNVIRVSQVPSQVEWVTGLEGKGDLSSFVKVYIPRGRVGYSVLWIGMVGDCGTTIMLLEGAWQTVKWAKRKWRIKQNRCPFCGYGLERLMTNRCPECGEEIEGSP